MKHNDDRWLKTKIAHTSFTIQISKTHSPWDHSSNCYTISEPLSYSMSQHINDVWKQSDNISNNVKDDNCAIDISAFRSISMAYEYSASLTWILIILRNALFNYYGPIIGLEDNFFFLKTELTSDYKIMTRQTRSVNLNFCKFSIILSFP